MAIVALASASACAGSAPGGAQGSAAVARRAALWLAHQVGDQGFVPTSSGSGPDLSSTAQSVLALAAADTGRAQAAAEMGYLTSHAQQYAEVDGAEGPGQLGILILDAEAMGSDPRRFGGTDLVAALLGTEQPSGPNDGMFGTDAQAADEVAGSYDQGIALAALAAAGVQGTAAVRRAAAWLSGQQCPGGGWTLPDDAANPCSGPSPDAGPDTNSTAMAVQGLAAQGDLGPDAERRAIGFLTRTQQPDGGWSLGPATSGGAQADPDSTALVIQALTATGVSVTGSRFARGSADPDTALLGFRVRQGTGAGAFYFPPAPAPANIIATYQAIPALLGLTVERIPSSSRFRNGGGG
ncbi:MAG TPA: prenyltransferase/squalene oxidase repeat-containing protein [Acidimicrobiales bacterium]|nr:prenyltransferase/squalene oxidase repeat-containing protein [Acidimicrobiales bacterium]